MSAARRPRECGPDVGGWGMAESECEPKRSDSRARRGQVTCPRTHTAMRSARTGHRSLPRADPARSCSSRAPPVSRAGTGHFRSELGDRGVKASPHRPQRILLPQPVDGWPAAVPPRPEGHRPRVFPDGGGGQGMVKAEKAELGEPFCGKQAHGQVGRASRGRRAAPPGT